MPIQNSVCVYKGSSLGEYGFPNDHPFGPWRMQAFWEEMEHHALHEQVCICEPVMADQEAIEEFHTHEYVEFVKSLSQTGQGYLDNGDTPAFKGMYEAAAHVVGSCIDAVERIISGKCRKAFVPIAGLHHARRDRAAGFCVFNDCGVVIENLRSHHGIQRVAYVDIDAHHGDGVYYGFVDNPDVYIADIHEDGHYLYPGTGAANETGKANAQGTKLNIPVPPGADDEVFKKVWPQLESFIRDAKPEFILLQSGADSIAGDPLTHMRFSSESHAYAATRLCLLADECCDGRILGMGGGGYDRTNLAKAWTAVVEAFIETE